MRGGTPLRSKQDRVGIDELSSPGPVGMEIPADRAMVLLSYVALAYESDATTR